MTARACSLLFACLLGSSLTHAGDDAAVSARRLPGIGHLPLAPGQRLPAPAAGQQGAAAQAAKPATPAPSTPAKAPALQPAKGADKTSDGGPFKLTVDAIMAGPKLVGYPPSGLRWSGDSQRLYFEWRKPEDDETSTWVVSRNGGEPRRLSDEERKIAPPPF